MQWADQIVFWLAILAVVGGTTYLLASALVEALLRGAFG